MPEKKCDHEEVGETAPLWIVSFADLVTLMLSFFVILAAGNDKKPEKDPKYTDVVAGVKMAFDYAPSPFSTDPIDMRIMMKQKGRGNGGNKGESSRKVDGAVGRQDLVTTIRTGTETTMGGVVLFEPDTAEMGPETVPTIARIAEIVRGYTNVFVVKGHTTPDEERRAVAEKRDLGYERANAVTAALVAQGVARTSLRVQSCRDYEPRAEAAYSDASRAANRRVEVFATEALVSEFQGDPAIVPQAPETTR